MKPHKKPQVNSDLNIAMKKERHAQSCFQTVLWKKKKPCANNDNHKILSAHKK